MVLDDDKAVANEGSRSANEPGRASSCPGVRELVDRLVDSGDAASGECRLKTMGLIARALAISS